MCLTGRALNSVFFRKIDRASRSRRRERRAQGEKKRSLSHAEPDAGTLSVRGPLLHRDVLPDQTGDLVGLLRLQSGDALLHQIAALHVEIERALLGLHLPGGDHLGVGIVIQGLLRTVEQCPCTSKRDARGAVERVSASSNEELVQ